MINKKINSVVKQLADRSLNQLNASVAENELREIQSYVTGDSNRLLEELAGLAGDTAAFREKLRLEYRNLETDLMNISDNEARIERMLDFLSLFSSNKQLRGDRKAFSRWMDIAAVRERARRELAHRERLTELTISMIGRRIADDIETGVELNQIMDALNRVNFFENLWNEFETSSRWQNQTTVIKFWKITLELIPPENRECLITESWRQKIEQICKDKDANVWVQIAAIQVLGLLNTSQTIKILKSRLDDPANRDDDMFVRSGILRYLTQITDSEQLRYFLDHVFETPDGSEHVRITAASLITDLDPLIQVEYVYKLMSKLPISSATIKVKTASLIALKKTFELTQDREILRTMIASAIDMICQRENVSMSKYADLALVELIGTVLTRNIEILDTDEIVDPEHQVLRCVDQMIKSLDYDDRVRRLASSIREQFLLAKDPRATRLKAAIIQKSRSVNEGEWFNIEDDLVPNENLLGRVMANIAENDLSLSAEKNHNGYRIFRGEIYKRRIWRIISELTAPNPAKRQGYLHTVGRRMIGTLRAPVRMFAEVTQTNVPGERLFIHEEYSWRPYIPTPDDILSLCSLNRKDRCVKIFTAEGITKLTGPKNLFDRFIVWLGLTMDYRRYADLRNMDARQIDILMLRSFVQAIYEDFDINVSFVPNFYHFRGMKHSSRDPVVMRNMAMKTQSTLR